MSSRVSSGDACATSRVSSTTRARRSRAPSTRPSPARTTSRSTERRSVGTSTCGEDDDAAKTFAQDALRRAALLASTPRECGFMAFLDRCRALDNDDANALVEAFCASERLDGQFCEDAFDCVYAAHARNAPEEELRTMMSLARLFMRRYRARETPARWRAVDAATTAARDAARAGVPGDAARDAIRRAVADVPDVTARDFMDAMREFRIKLNRDDRLETSYAREFFDADERAVRALGDPLDELRASASTRRELLTAVDLVFDACIDDVDDVRRVR